VSASEPRSGPISLARRCGWRYDEIFRCDATLQVPTTEAWRKLITLDSSCPSPTRMPKPPGLRRLHHPLPGDQTPPDTVQSTSVKSHGWPSAHRPEQPDCVGPSAIGPMAGMCQRTKSLAVGAAARATSYPPLDNADACLIPGLPRSGQMDI
jgi:hypothetical protein